MKICGRCKIEKSLEEFAKNASKSDGLQHQCRDCKKVSDRVYHAANRDKQIARTQQARIVRRDYILSYLKIHPCVDCGNTDVRVLEFDHQKDKVDNISNMIAQCVSFSKLDKEIAKCEVVCANCHRIRTCNTYPCYKNAG